MHTQQMKLAGALLIGISAALFVLLIVIRFLPFYTVLPVLIGLVAGVTLLVMGIVGSKTPSASQASAPTATVHPPGWYPATDGSGRVMWWDGQEWSQPPGSTA